MVPGLSGPLHFPCLHISVGGSLQPRRKRYYTRKSARKDDIQSEKRLRFRMGLRVVLTCPRSPPCRWWSPPRSCCWRDSTARSPASKKLVKQIKKKELTYMYIERLNYVKIIIFAEKDSKKPIVHFFKNIIIFIIFPFINTFLFCFVSTSALSL